MRELYSDKGLYSTSFYLLLPSLSLWRKGCKRGVESPPIHRDLYYRDALADAFGLAFGASDALLEHYDR